MRYGAVQALNSLTLDVGPGELRAVIGPNGAGKSTLHGLIAGERRPVTGRIEIDGSDVTASSAADRVKLGIVRTFQVTRTFVQLTALENVAVGILARNGEAHVFWRPVRQDVWRGAREGLRKVGLEALAKRPARELTQGNRKRLEIAMALTLSPRLFLLDEPTAGMSPEETVATVDLIRELWKAERMTVLLTEHDMSVVFSVAETITVLHQGREVATDSPEVIRKRADIKDIYFGRA